MIPEAASECRKYDEKYKWKKFLQADTIIANRAKDQCDLQNDGGPADVS